MKFTYKLLPSFDIQSNFNMAHKKSLATINLALGCDNSPNLIFAFMNDERIVFSFYCCYRTFFAIKIRIAEKWKQQQEVISLGIWPINSNTKKRNI